MTPRHLLALDGVRGLAALAVVLYHLQGIPTVGGFLPSRGAYLAVDLFFLLSGFVIGLAYEEGLRAGRIGFWAFVRARLVRLYPLYLLACGLGLSYFVARLVLPSADPVPVDDLLISVGTSLLLLPYPPAMEWAFSMHPFALPAWSLSLELWFNVVYALGVYRLSTRALAGIALVALLGLAQQAWQYGGVNLGAYPDDFLGGVLRFWFSFTAGLILYRLRDRWMRPAGWLTAAAALALLFPAIPKDAVGLSLLWIAVVFPLGMVLAAPVHLSGAAAFVADHLGRLSYGLYILHMPVLLWTRAVMGVVLGDAAENLSPFVNGAIYVAAILAVTVPATYLFDEPLRAAMKHRRTTRAAA